MKLYKNIITALSICLVATSCVDLDKVPTGELSSANAFLTSGELEKYCNRFYNLICKTHGGYGSGDNIGCGDNRTDNGATNSVNTRFMGATALSSASSLSQYTQIRGINFLINNFDNCSEVSEDVDHSWGEIHYFRAYYYFDMLVDYGPIAWVDVVLDADLEECTLPRDSRTTIVDNILNDLDIAIEYLYEQSDNTSMRIHKDVARAFKAEVALFEGTWEKYHKGTVFADPDITDSKIEEYLEAAAAAAKAVIDRGVWSIYSGDGDNSYNRMFTLTDQSSNQEVLWWKKYDYSESIAHSFSYYHYSGGGQSGLSKSLIDDYLTIDGEPYVGEARTLGKLTYGEELKPTIRDPRLSQTVACEGDQMYAFGDTDGDGDAASIYTMPPLDASSWALSATGYSIRKHIEWDTDLEDNTAAKGQNAAIQYRYAYVLLMYAEALAELDGAANASAIIEAIRPIRQRSGINMPDVDFDREFNDEADYGFRNVDKYIQAVRRERRVELAAENHRFYDIMRWAAADELIVGKCDYGVLYTGSTLEEYFKEKGGGDDSYLTDNIILTADGYIQPYSFAAFDTDALAFDVNRDYLLPIQSEMISLTGGLWEQNPGW